VKVIGGTRIGSVLAGVIVYVWMVVPTLLAGTEVEWKGELTAWTSASRFEDTTVALGFRYLPGVTISAPLVGEWQWDAEATVNLYGLTRNPGGGDSTCINDARFYRLWSRWYSEAFEIRLGMQEISFGPAKLLRTLRWFDQKDSLDPTGFTEGVRGLLLRYYFESNTNLWGWLMAGNDEPMGISPLITLRDTIEGGGRWQWLSGPAEFGVTVHRRRVDPVGQLGSGLPASLPTVEERLGFDVGLNLGIGLYAEGALIRLEEGGGLPEEQRWSTLGADYTFDIGEGLGAMVELMTVNVRSKVAPTIDETNRIWAFSGQYGLNLFDRLELLAFRHEGSAVTLLQAFWKRTTDDFDVTTVLTRGFCPDKATSAALPVFFPLGDVCGEGLRLMVQYHY
jgi:hypothetical protein